MSSVEQLYSPELLKRHQSRVQKIRSSSASAAGAIAGILGLTNLLGFGFYVIASVIVGLAVFATAGKGSRAVSPKGGAVQALSSGLLDMESMTGYILWWTLLYGIMHVYE